MQLLKPINTCILFGFRSQERDSGLGTILSESSISMEQSEANIPSDTSDEELAQLSNLASMPQQQHHQTYHQYTNDLQSGAVDFGPHVQHQQFQMKPSCKL